MLFSVCYNDCMSIENIIQAIDSASNIRRDVVGLSDDEYREAELGRSGSLDEAVNSVLATLAVRWINRQVKRVPFVCENNAELNELLTNPYPGLYSAEDLNASIVRDAAMHGAGFVRVVRGGDKEDGPIERLVYINYSSIDTSSFDVTKLDEPYKYTALDGQLIEVPPKNMLVFRWELGNNIRTGVSPFALLGKLMYIDERAFEFLADVFANSKMGVMLSPLRREMTLTDEERNRIEKKLDDVFDGNGAGMLMVFAIAMQWDFLLPSFDKVDIGRFTAQTETRISSAIGLNPSILSWLSGIEATQVGATADTYRREGWTGAVMPALRMLKSTYQTQLATLYTGNPIVDYDISDISELRISVDEASTLVTAGILSAQQAAEMLGYEYDSSQIESVETDDDIGEDDV